MSRLCLVRSVSATNAYSRDSKSSNGTQSSRYYNNQYGSTSTLPSSADTDSNDNMFAVPRPHIGQHSSSPSSLSMGAMKKQLPAIPKPASKGYGESTSPTAGIGRVRAMTSSSYASTAKPPTLDADLNFGSGFDDLFSGLDRKESPDYTNDSPGRSLLDGKRTFQAEPIKVDRTLEVEPPLKSWDSRGSADNLMPSPRSPDDDSPPPVPPHKFSHSQYAPVASHSPDLNGGSEFEDSDAKIVRQSVMARKSTHESSPEQHPTSLSSSAPSLQTPLSSRSTSHNATPKAALRPAISPLSEDEDNLFAAPKAKETPITKPATSLPKDFRPNPPASTDSSRRVMTQAEFKAQQQRQMTQPVVESSDEEDYEDEEDAEEKAQQEAIARRKKQQMDMARETMRRTITAPANPNRPDSVTEPFTMGFPSETSLKADEWEDEDIPLGILAQHGFPSAARGKPPVQPANAIPSYFRNSTPSLPERPASAGAMSNRASQAFKPVFARNLPEDPHASFIGGGLVRPTNRESLGFNRGPASIAGEPAGGMSMPLMAYPEPQLTAPSLVEQIHMRDLTKQKYMGGASSKKPQQGPFTGLLGAQMNASNQNTLQNRMSQMPMMNGMNGMPGMNGMNGMAPMMNMNMMGSPMGMPMMGMNQMAYPMQQNELMQMQQMQQMQQMLAAQQLQIQQMQALSQQPQDSRMSMAFPPSFSNNNFLGVPAGPQRPMSMMSVGNNQPPRPFSTPIQMGGGLHPTAPLAGYTPSIAPSERSNIGLSARYRPVATHHDATSTVSSMTLQASGGAAQNSQSTVKGILKMKKSGPTTPGATPPGRENDDDDDGWGKMAATRKSKFLGGGLRANDDGATLRELVRGVDSL